MVSSFLKVRLRIFPDGVEPPRHDFCQPTPRQSGIIADERRAHGCITPAKTAGVSRRYKLKGLIMKNVGLAVCALFLCGNVTFGQSYSRPSSGFVLDKTSTISNSDERKVNEVCRQIKNATNGEILVAIVPSTNGQNPRQFATKLFNRWGIGDAYSNRGILVFVAINDRKAEIVLGDGIDSAREEEIARSIMSDHMMPKFKQRKPSVGIRIAVEECAKQFFKTETSGAAVEVAESSSTESVRTTIDQVAALKTPEDPILAETNEAIWNEDEAGDFANQDSDVLPEHPTKPVAQNQPQLNRPRNHARGNNGGGFMRKLLALLGGGVTAGGAGFGCYRLATARRRPRNCEKCSQPMSRLDEVADDAHLNDAEQIEERIGSVDYDVWVCTACDHAQKIRYGAFFSRYSKCPRCNAKTASSTTSTIRHATTISQGLKEVEEECENCDFHRITEHAIPRIVETDHSSSSFSSGGGSSFGGGGGTSSGGGASGSW